MVRTGLFYGLARRLRAARSEHRNPYDFPAPGPPGMAPRPHRRPEMGVASQRQEPFVRTI